MPHAVLIKLVAARFHCCHIDCEDRSWLPHEAGIASGGAHRLEVEHIREYLQEQCRSELVTLTPLLSYSCDRNLGRQ